MMRDERISVEPENIKSQILQKNHEITPAIDGGDESLQSAIEPPTIAITIGDPAGIGPEVVLKALADSTLFKMARWLVIGDAHVLAAVGVQTGLEPPDCVIEEVSQRPASTQVCVLDLHQLDASQFQIGRLSPACGRAGLEYVRKATHLCLDDQADAMVTAPLNKEAVALTGLKFSGHTEFIADLCGGVDSRMLLISDRLRIVHVSTHCALRQACELEPSRILRTIQLGHEALQSLDLPQPRIAVCGLNPHAGENGLFGGEDREFIVPAVQAAQQMGMQCEGPFPADTLFLKAVKGGYDLVVAMYHDQGHIPMKLLDFERAVNVSLGFPIIRTSVDHGTAFDIAGKNQADPSSMKAAMQLAVTMAKTRRIRESVR